jgi:protein SCO1/2
MKMITCLLLFSSVSLLAAAPAPCCLESKPVKTDSCCEALAAAPFSKTSIYQADANFVTDTGAPFKLSNLRNQLVVLTMFYASCSYACPLTVADMQTIRGKLPPELRQRIAFVLVSFDVARDTPEILAKYREQRGLDSSWTLLRGNDDSIRELAALIGVKFKPETDGTFSHSNLVTILNAQGEIVHQRLGLQGGLDEAAAALTALK